MIKTAIAIPFQSLTLCFAAGIAISMLPFSSSAQQPTISSLEAGSTTDAPVEIAVLKLSAAAEPIPAMSHRLWPDRMKLQPGNAMIRFQRAVLLMSQTSRDKPETSREFWDNWTKWIDMPVGQLPCDEVRKSLDLYRLCLRELHNGRLLRESGYDLPIEQIKGVETIELLLPEFQEMRSLSRLLQLEIRLAIAERRFEDAIELLQTGFRLGEATGQAVDYLVGRLVGLAISGIMLGEVENLLQTQGCPNLYWALASLPPSLSEVLESIQFEASVVSRVFDSLEDLPEHGKDAEVWEKLALSLLIDFQKIQEYGIEDSKTLETKTRLLAGLAIVSLADYSRIQLIDTGIEAEVVEAMSPAEAVIRATAWSLQTIQDDFVKWTYVPAELRRTYLNSAEQALRGKPGASTSFGDLGTIIAGLLLPAIQAADSAGVRTEQQIAKLITIEAIRNHVSKHAEVPNDLQQLKDLPAWQDPVTGEAFGYEKTAAKTAKLSRAPRWNGDTDTTVTLSFED